jgi:hypothetical protein
MSTKPNAKHLSVIVTVALTLCVMLTASFLVIKKFYRGKPVTVISTETKKRPDKVYREMLIDYYSMISMARDIFPVDTALAAREKSLSDIKDVGIYYWDRSLTTLDSLNKFELTEEQRSKLAAHKAFCSLNKQCYELMYKAVDERSGAYDSDIESYFAEIDQKATELPELLK